MPPPQGDPRGRRILVVDDDHALVQMVALELEDEGVVLEASNGNECLDALQAHDPHIVILDLGLPDVNELELLEKVHSTYPELPILILSARSDLRCAVECMRMGATDYVLKPFDRVRLVTAVSNACSHGELRATVRRLTDELHRGAGFDGMVGHSRAFDAAIDMLMRAAQSDVTVLIEGESGTGKELAARSIHASGSRASKPFVAVNCGAIPESLIESELFGHEKGSFTGAVTRRKGCFEEADGGTVFLDEIGELHANLQVKFLRVLQEREVCRVGSNSPLSVDVRVIAATNRVLKTADDFRRDLYYRLAIFPIHLPALRERHGDVALLANACLERLTRRHGKQFDGISPRAQGALEAYTWPGNVRELENVLERAVIISDGPVIDVDALPGEVFATDGSATSEELVRESGDDEILPLVDQERRIISSALRLTNWNVREAAKRLGIGRATIYRKMEKYELKQPD